VSARHVCAQIDGVLGVLLGEQAAITPRFASSVARHGPAQGEEPGSERALTAESCEMTLDEEEHFMHRVHPVHLGNAEPRHRPPHEIRVQLVGSLKRHHFGHVVST